MISLLIDTSVESSTIIFFRNKEILFKGTVFSVINSSKFIFSEISKGVKELNLNLSQIDYIAVCIGPGSYTGTRVGVTIAKSLSYALKIPVIPFCSLHVYLPVIEDGFFVSMIDAKSGGAYYQKARIVNDKIKWIDIPKINYLDFIFKDIEGTSIVSPNFKSIKEKVGLIFPEKTFVWVESEQNYSYINTLCHEKFLKKEFESIDILYLK